MIEKTVAEMTDEEFLLAAYKGSRPAVVLAQTLRNISHTLDDIIDGDKEVTKDRVVGAFWDAMIHVSSNPFFIEHAAFLRPLMSSALVNWQIANVFEQIGGEERHIAHSMRYDLATVLVMMAYLIGGRNWAEMIGPEIRKRCQRESLADYLVECDKRFPQQPPPKPEAEKKKKGDK